MGAVCIPAWIHRTRIDVNARVDTASMLMDIAVMV